MRLINVRLKNFMLYKDKVINFEPGINVIRGDNEKGKSSILFGISYNWFGAGFLPQVLDDTVTWGSKKTSLFTETTFVVRGEIYTCRRSSRGAELYKKGHAKPLVTGQKEVSAAVADLFNLPSVQSASKLIIAPQDNIRGIISLGSVAAASFIEELIDMKEIDNLIKDLSSRLVHSHDAKKQVLADIDSVKIKISELQEIKSTKDVDKKIKAISPKHIKLTKQCADAQDTDTEAGYKLRDCRSAQTRNTESSDTAIEDAKEIENRIAEQNNTTLVTPEDISKAENLLEESRKYSYYTEKLLPQLSKNRPDVVWEGDAESFSAYRQQLADTITEWQKKIAEKNAIAVSAREQIIEDRICPTCGTELHDEEATEKTNALLEQKIKGLQDEIVVLEGEKEQNEDDLRIANIAQDYHLLQNQWVALYTDELNEIGLIVGENTVPFTISVNKPPEKPKDNITEAAVALLVKKSKEQQLAIANLENDKQTLKDLGEKLKELDAELIRLQKKETELKLYKESTANSLIRLNQKLSDLNDQKVTLDNTKSTIVTENKFITNSREALDKELATNEAAVTEIQSNSDLITAVREARINISNILWQKLLGVTETYFSLFRGKPSTLSISKKGILVDDHLSAPSGSTLDVLGIALRLAIGKLFSDNGFCALDEPSAGCDQTRTAALAAGLISADMEQTIMVTHKDVDENIGNLIAL